MKVVSIEPAGGEIVKMEDGTEYLRYASDVWMRGYGESWESDYHCEKQEAAYQQSKVVEAKP